MGQQRVRHDLVMKQQQAGARSYGIFGGFLLLFFGGFFFSIYLFIWLHHVLIVAHEIFNLHCTMRDLQPWHVGSSSLTKDPTQADCIGSAQS